MASSRRLRETLGAGARAGAAAGLLTVGAMYLVAAVAGVQPLPELLQQPVLAAMPGPLFGFLIDRLQHAGKVVEEAGLIAAMILALAGLGAAVNLAQARWGLPRRGLTAAAAGYLAITLGALPAAGEGLLGLSGGPAVPVAWALVMAVYAAAFEAAARLPGREVDAGRRRLLRLLPAGLALAGLAGVAGFRAPAWLRALEPAPVGGPVPEVTPVARFYQVSKNFRDPVVPAAGWTLRVHGLVEKGLSLGYGDLRGLPAVTEAVTLACVSNTVGGGLISTGRFTGVALRDLVALARPRPEAGALNFKARDGFHESLPLSLVMAEPEIMLAYGLEGAPLPDRHGHPARVLIPGRYGMKGPKWLDEIEIARTEADGYWEAQGWSRQAVVKTFSRFDFPAPGALLRIGPLTLAGVAFAGRRGIQAVEWSADGGRNWALAELRPPLSPLTWVLWSAVWTPVREGVHTLAVRARDGAGALQTRAAAASFPNGAEGWHTVRVSIGR